MTDDSSAGSRVTPQQWKWTVLAGMASYLDAGSIVALGSGLTLFQKEFTLGDGAVGLLTAIGPNAIGCGLGAFIGGRLGDKLGRKRIYKWDLLIYALGILLIAASVNSPMLFVGTFVVGLAVGADVPTSLALVGEISPAKARGRLIGSTQIAWSLGPVVVLVLAFSVSSLGLLGTRIVFLHLLVVALVTWALRQGLAESAVWKSASETTITSARRIRQLFRGPNLRALAYTGLFYLFWNIPAGTNGIFTPYIVETLGAGTQAEGLILQCVSFILTIGGVVLVFMPYSDRSFGARRWMMGVGAAMQVLSFVLFLLLPFTVPTILAYLGLFGIGCALAGEPFYKTFSQELFPTMLRGTAQGLTFGVARLFLGGWSFLVPVLASTGITTVAALLAGSALLAGIIGYFGMPDTSGKSLGQIESERSSTTGPTDVAGRSPDVTAAP